MKYGTARIILFLLEITSDQRAGGCSFFRVNYHVSISSQSNVEHPTMRQFAGVRSIRAISEARPGSLAPRPDRLRDRGGGPPRLDRGGPVRPRARVRAGLGVPAIPRPRWQRAPPRSGRAGAAPAPAAAPARRARRSTEARYRSAARAPRPGRAWPAA